MPFIENKYLFIENFSLIYAPKAFGRSLKRHTPFPEKTSLNNKYRWRKINIPRCVSYFFRLHKAVFPDSYKYPRPEGKVFSLNYGVSSFNYGIPLCNKVIPLSNKGIPLCNKVIPLCNKVIPLCNKVIPLSNKVIPLSDKGIPTFSDGVFSWGKGH